MPTVGVLATFEFTPGQEADVARFFSEGRAIVEGQPATTGWFAFRTGPTGYSAFAVFATEADRETLLAAGGPQLSRAFAHIFAAPPTFQKVDVVESRLPASAELGQHVGPCLPDA